MCAIRLKDSCFGMLKHTYSRRDKMSHVYLGYMHQIYMNVLQPCSRLHSCKQYVQEARDNLDQGYDAYTYLEFLSILVVETHLRKQCQETQGYSTNQKAIELNSSNMWRTYRRQYSLRLICLQDHLELSPLDVKLQAILSP